MVKQLKEKILKGEYISREEAEELINVPLDELCEGAEEIRRKLCTSEFHMCTIINGKSGRCSEDCKYCAQSAHFNTNVEVYPLLAPEKVVKNAVSNFKDGVHRFSIVTSGKRLSDFELKKVCEINKEISKACSIELCGSHGLLSLNQLRELKESGVTRYHNNLETARSFFENICTTHSYDEKVQTIKDAKEAGLEVCSGGIFGLGENMHHRIEMAFELRDLEVDSVPVNILNPIEGTPMWGNESLTYDEIVRTIAIYRFIMPDKFIRLAGGRALLGDKGRRAFMSGANSAISGDLLTTAGISTAEDIAMVKELGYSVKENE
ncbi:biotin synthase BioB [Clostridium culturomicium]|uniref:biotin synthase BioB n=1 Tax=Clostridium culturomicium TaxID=1499683 RepID=UPI003857CDF5